jgi:hypothetical protein
VKRRTRAGAPARTAEETYSCPDCDKDGFQSMHGLNTHRKFRHGTGPLSEPAKARTATGGRGAAAATEAHIRAQRDMLVTNLSLAGMLVGSVLPHTGLTIVTRAADRPILDPNTNQQLTVDGVPQVKRGIASVVMELAQRDERILFAVERFNRIFAVSDGVELLLSVGAAVAADVGVDPNLEIPAGPLGTIQPIRQLIPDVVDVIEEMREEEGAQGGQGEQPQQAPNGATVILGDVTKT